MRDVRDRNDQSPAVGEGFAVFPVGGADVVVESADPADPEEAAMVGRFTGISFAVDDIGHAYDTLRAAGVRFDGAPEVQPFTAVEKYFLASFFLLSCQYALPIAVLAWMT